MTTMSRPRIFITHSWRNIGFTSFLNCFQRRQWQSPREPPCLRQDQHSLPYYQVLFPN